MQFSKDHNNKYDVVISKLENESIIRRRNFDEVNKVISNEKKERIEGDNTNKIMI